MASPSLVGSYEVPNFKEVVFLSKNMSLELTKYRCVFTPRFSAM